MPHLRTRIQQAVASTVLSGAPGTAFEIETAQAEITFHKIQELEEIRWTRPEDFSFIDYLADFRVDFHDLRGDLAFANCLAPQSYHQPQLLARELLAQGSGGIVYPSVRRQNGTCIACFRPALVTNVRAGGRITMTIQI